MACRKSAQGRHEIRLAGGCHARVTGGKGKTAPAMGVAPILRLLRRAQTRRESSRVLTTTTTIGESFMAKLYRRLVARVAQAEQAERPYKPTAADRREFRAYMAWRAEQATKPMVLRNWSQHD